MMSQTVTVCMTVMSCRQTIFRVVDRDYQMPTGRLHSGPQAGSSHGSNCSHLRPGKKMNKSPCSSPFKFGLAAMQRGHRHRLHRWYCCLFLGSSGLYPGCRALGCCLGGTPLRWRYLAGTLGDIQSVTHTRSQTPLLCHIP